MTTVCVLVGPATGCAGGATDTEEAALDLEDDMPVADERAEDFNGEEDLGATAGVASAWSFCWVTTSAMPVGLMPTDCWN